MKNPSTITRWSAIYTKSKYEKKVFHQLAEKGFEVYLPLITKRQKWSDRKKWVEYPLFKSYVFVKYISEKNLSILRTHGVVKIIKFGNEIATIDQKSIDAVKLMLRGGYRPETTDYYIKGDIVEVVDGPLKGIHGEVARIDGNDRLIVRIDCIKYSISIQIEKSLLKKSKNFTN